MKISSGENIEHHAIAYFTASHGGAGFEEKLKGDLLDGLFKPLLDSGKVSVTEMSDNRRHLSKYIAEVHIHSSDEINAMMSCVRNIEALLLKNVTPEERVKWSLDISNLKNLIKP